MSWARSLLQRFIPTPDPTSRKDTRSQDLDVFINYSREDTVIAKRIASFLEANGFSLFWDRSIPAGATFTEVIEQALQAARCVITLWSESAVKSNWVLAEAEMGLQRRILYPIAIGSGFEIPAPFNRIQTEFIDHGDLDKDAWLNTICATARQIVDDPERQGDLAVPDRKVASANEWKPNRVAADIRDRDARKKAFISYSGEDEEIAIDLTKDLESSGCPCWISFRDVDPGDDYRASITRAMDEISFLVLVYSAHVNHSFDVATELILARKRGRKRFVLRTDDTEPDGPVEYELATVQWIDCQENRPAAFKKIAQRAELL